jgi:4'-phosphopantetheinyl transferase
VHLWCVPLTLARPALRSILAGYLGVQAGRVPLGRAPGGKPCLDGGAGPAFNLSHSGPLAVIAVSTRDTVGVDIEQLRGRSRDGLIDRVLDAEEAEVVRACVPAKRERAFLRHWTAKESCLKAWGTGLSGDLRALRIGNALGSPIVMGDAASQLELQRFDPCPDVVGTVAVSGGPWRAVSLTFTSDCLVAPDPLATRN